MFRRTSNCYFCNSSTHNIKRCDDERLLNFKLYCISLKEVYQTSIVVSKQKFGQTLSTVALNDNTNIVKAFAMNACGAVRLNNIQTCIDKITNYIFNSENTILNSEKIVVLLKLDETYNINNANNTKNCIICMEDKKEEIFMKFMCNHEYCAHCVNQILRPNLYSNDSHSQNFPICPLCRTRITTITVKNIIDVENIIT
jgi:hypothetical protein